MHFKCFGIVKFLIHHHTHDLKALIWSWASELLVQVKERKKTVTKQFEFHTKTQITNSICLGRGKELKCLVTCSKSGAYYILFILLRVQYFTRIESNNNESNLANRSFKLFFLFQPNTISDYTTYIISFSLG